MSTICPVLARLYFFFFKNLVPFCYLFYINVSYLLFSALWNCYIEKCIFESFEDNIWSLLKQTWQRKRPGHGRWLTVQAYQKYHSQGQGCESQAVTDSFHEVKPLTRHNNLTYWKRKLNISPCFTFAKIQVDWKNCHWII